jgi:hypothetical protein
VWFEAVCMMQTSHWYTSLVNLLMSLAGMRQEYGMSSVSPSNFSLDA